MTETKVARGDHPIAMNVNEGVALNQSATGRRLGVVPYGHGTSFFRIKYIDGKPGDLPEKWTGRYTSPKYAQDALTDFIRETWAVAAERTKK